MPLPAGFLLAFHILMTQDRHHQNRSETRLDSGLCQTAAIQVQPVANLLRHASVKSRAPTIPPEFKRLAFKIVGTLAGIFHQVNA
jgi:hypothetical protein